MKNNLVLAFFLILGALSATPPLIITPSSPQQDWSQFKKDYGKKYKPEEQTSKLAIFAKNLQRINTNNGKQNHLEKINQFGDLTQTQFAQIYLTTIPIQKTSIKVEKPPTTTTDSMAKVSSTKLSANPVDWRNVYYLVKNQGTCGSGWAFSGNGVIEGTVAVQKSQKVVLSEQQLVDCVTAPNYKSMGCSSGIIYQSLNYIGMFGISSFAAYPYTAQAGSCNPSLTSSGSTYVSQTKPFNLYTVYLTLPYQLTSVSGVQNLLKNGPLSVAVDASNWQFYLTGVLSKCTKNTNHGAVLVGYQTDGTWIVRNSWGTTWGESGYIRLAAGDTCGVLKEIYSVNLV